MRVALWRCCLVLFLSTAAVWGAVSRKSDPRNGREKAMLFSCDASSKRRRKLFKRGCRSPRTVPFCITG